MGTDIMRWSGSKDEVYDMDNLGECYCEMCGNLKHNQDCIDRVYKSELKNINNINLAVEAILKLSHIYNEDKILFQILMLKINNLEMSSRDIAEKITDDGYIIASSTVRTIINKSCKDNPFFLSMFKLSKNSRRMEGNKVKSKK